MVHLQYYRKLIPKLADLRLCKNELQSEYNLVKKIPCHLFVDTGRLISTLSLCDTLAMLYTTK